MSELSQVDIPALRAQALFDQHGILITCFSYGSDAGLAFRFYFRDIHRNHFHNPLQTLENGKKCFPIYTDYRSGLIAMVDAAEEYLTTLHQQSVVDKSSPTK